MIGPYDRTTRDGHTLNYRTLEMLRAAERTLYFPITVTQGSYNAGGVGASAGTHDGGGVIDLRATTLNESQRLATVVGLRIIGFAAWLRTPSQGDWPYHIHAVAIGDQELSDSAARQVVAYKSGRNGLANNGVDDGPTVTYKVYPQTLKELWMDAKELQTALKATPIDNRVTEEPGDSVSLALLLATMRKQLFDMANSPDPIVVELPSAQEERMVAEITRRVLAGFTGLEFQAGAAD